MFKNCVSKGRDACCEMVSEGFSFNRSELPSKKNVHRIRIISREYGVRSSASRRAAASPSIWHGCPRAQRCRSFWLVLLTIAKSFYDDESKSDMKSSQVLFKFCHAMIGDGGHWSKDRARERGSCAHLEGDTIW